MNLLVFAGLALLLAVPSRADVAVTVYNQDRALVKDGREVTLQKGAGRLSFDDVAAMIEPASVSLTFPRGGEKYSVLEQNFEYDLVSHEKLLQKYIGKEIEIVRRLGASGDRTETVRGTLLSTGGGITLQTDSRILLNPPGEISLARLPEGLILKPTLSWLIDSPDAGRTAVELAYLTRGMSWSADYVAVADADDRKIDLTGWVTIDNRSGAAYPNARLKLVAGDVNRAQPAMMDRIDEGRGFAKAMAAPAFQEKSFFEYHLYTLQRRTTLKDNETKQIEFIRSQSIPVRRVYAFHGSPVGTFDYQEWMRADRNYGKGPGAKVQVTLELKNSANNNLGIPLPRGTVRVYKKDSDGSLELIGEDAIDHTPKDEELRLLLGNAFDIAGEREQTAFKCGDDWCEESFKITLRNHKAVPVEVKVVEPMYRWSYWKILESSPSYAKKDATTIESVLKVPSEGQTTFTYTVRYWW